LDIVEAIDAIRDAPGEVARFCASVVSLANNLIFHHGVFQGSQEAALAEAQGAQLFQGGSGTVVKHLQSVREAGRALANRQLEIQNGLNFFARFSADLAAKLREILNPLLRASDATRAVIAETESMAADLARTNATRLQGIALQTGPRDVALISNQLNAQNAALAARGAPTTLLPDPGTAQAYLSRVRQMAIDAREAASRIVPMIAAIRVACTQALARASVVGRALLSTVLDALSAALEAVIQAGTLITPIIIIVPPKLPGSMRLEDTMA
jgi:hypothetical protein